MPETLKPSKSEFTRSPFNSGKMQDQGDSHLLVEWACSSKWAELVAMITTGLYLPQSSVLKLPDLLIASNGWKMMFRIWAACFID